MDEPLPCWMYALLVAIDSCWKRSYKLISARREIGAFQGHKQDTVSICLWERMRFFILEMSMIEVG